MTIKMNLAMCKNCGYSLIDEEIDKHICKKL
jgi:predicted Zn-ribbon and HTH transcriptional regulator